MNSTNRNITSKNFVAFCTLLLNLLGSFYYSTAMESEKKEGALKKAIEYEGLYGVRRLLPKLTNADLQWQRETAVHFGIRKLADRELIDELLTKDPSLLEVTNKDQETPLLLAVDENPAMVGFLASKGANVHAKNRLGRGVLHLAAYKAFKETDIDLFDVLIDTEASKDLNDQDSYGETSLHFLARYYHKNGDHRFNIWIQTCADREECSLNIADDEGNTIVDILRRRNCKKKVDYVKGLGGRCNNECSIGERIHNFFAK